MPKDMLKLPNNKKGFVILLVLEALVAVWALAATYYAISHGLTRTVIYGAITLFAIFYIFGRSLRSFCNIVRRDREEAAQEHEGGNA